MPREKYRVHEVAKDFGINSKKILEILDGNSPEPRKHMTALEDAELDLIFDTITKENEVESFDEYFAAGEREKAEKQAAKEAAEEEKTEAAEETPVSACGVELCVAPTVRTICSCGVANFMNFWNKGEIKKMILADAFGLELTAF